MTAAILHLRPAARPGIAKPNGATIDFVRMFGLGRRWQASTCLPLAP
jgi:hypothetical protein